MYELVDTAQHTAGLLQTGGVHGAPLDAEAAELEQLASKPLLSRFEGFFRTGKMDFL